MEFWSKFNGTQQDVYPILSIGTDETDDNNDNGKSLTVAFLIAADNFVNEYRDRVKDMSFDDYVSCRKMDLLIETFHNNALFEEFFLSLKKLGISEWDCLIYIYEHDEMYTSKMKEIMASYIKATKDGLYDSYEQAKLKSVVPVVLNNIFQEK